MGNEMVIVRNPDALALWQERIRECRNSGQTVVAWCAENGISEKTYYYWHRKLARLQEMQAEPVRPAFFEVNQERHPPAEISATVQYGGIRADVYTGADEETLLRLFRVLKQC